MLGEKLGEFRGKVVGQRVLLPEGSVPKFETTVELSGTVLGVASTFTATFWSVIRPDGKIYAENPGSGVIVTEDGDMALFRATGLGGFTGRGSANKLRGASYWETTSHRLAQLGQEAHVYEWEVDENGEARWSFWEWT